MKVLCHQNICQLYEVLETEEEIYMILEVVTLYNQHNNTNNIFNTYAKLLEVEEYVIPVAMNDVYIPLINRVRGPYGSLWSKREARGWRGP